MELTELLEICAPQEQAELKVMANAVSVNLRNYNNDPSAVNLKNWTSAKESLEMAQKQIEEKHRKASNDVLEWAEFEETKNKADVLRQLQAMGYDLTQRTFYRHCKQGKCRINSKKVFSRRLVKQYVETEGLYREGEGSDGDSGPNVALSIEKQRLENEKLKINNRHAALKLKKDDGLLLEREALYLEMASRAVALDNGFRQMIDMEAATLISAVKGDVARQVEFIDLMNQAWNGLLNSFATTDEFEVLFEDDEMERPE